MSSSLLAAAPAALSEARPSRAPTWSQRLLRRRVEAALGRLRSGAIALREGGREVVLGDPHGPLGAIDLEVRSPQLWNAIAFGGDVGAGEAFVAGHWHSTDLVGLVRLLTRDRAVLLELDGSWLSWPVRLLRALGHRLRHNSRGGSRRNVRDHYDLGDELFACFLDPTMTYSSARYTRPGQTLESAQREKLRRLCRLVDVQAGDELLEIGTGWGSLATTAAAEFGAQVTTTTISANQFAYARERVRAAGLAERVRVLQQDYRDLDGRFDKLLSCEMVEAVGARYLPTFLRKCSALMRPGGVLGLQAITIKDQHYRAALRAVDYIKEHVFPGSFIPSVTALVTAATQHTDLRLEFCEDFGPDYATTIAAWRQRLHTNARPFLERPDGEAVLRAWDYYFAYCEAGFRERHIGCCHLRFARS